MMNFKSHSGFSLIEVLVALAIVSIVTVAIFIAQANFLKTARTTAQEIQIVAEMKNFFIEAEKRRYTQNDKKQEKKIESIFDGRLIYSSAKTKSKSLKDVPGIIIERIDATWLDGSIERKKTLVKYTYVMPEKKK